MKQIRAMNVTCGKDLDTIRKELTTNKSDNDDEDDNTDNELYDYERNVVAE